MCAMGASPLEDTNVLGCVFSHLNCTDFARARAVCPCWRKVLDDTLVRKELFKRVWGLSEVIGHPRNSNTYLVAELKQFAERVVLEGDESLASLAIRHNADPVSLRMLNNLFTEMAIRSRHTLYFPVKGRDDLEGKVARFTYDSVICRDIVLIADSVAALEEPALPGRGIGRQPRKVIAADLIRKLSELLGRGLHISEDTAQYYLDEAHGDLRLAVQKYREDQDWESQQDPVRRRRRRNRVCC